MFLSVYPRGIVEPHPTGYDIPERQKRHWSLKNWLAILFWRSRRALFIENARVLFYCVDIYRLCKFM